MGEIDKAYKEYCKIEKIDHTNFDWLLDFIEEDETEIDTIELAYLTIIGSY